METLLTVLSYVFWVGLALGLLVFIHELGHFLAAKLFKMRVEQFSIGFPPRILSKRVGETEYRIGAVPLGGYVKISGMVDESMDTDWVGTEPQPWEFRAKPVWQRVIVISAGVIFNLILAFAIFIGLKWYYGDSYIPAQNVGAVYVSPGSVAEEFGLRTGDRLVAINGEPLEEYAGTFVPRLLAADRPTITVERGDEEITLTAPPDLVNRLNQVSSFGTDLLPPIIGGVAQGSPADEAGLRPGDRIVAIGGTPVRFWMQMSDLIQAADGAPVTVRWARPDSLAVETELEPVGLAPRATLYEVAVAPRLSEADGRFVLGVNSPSMAQVRAIFGVKERSYGLGGAIRAGSAETVELLALYGRLVKRLFTGQDDVRESVGGPVMIAKVTKEAADAGMRSFWGLVAMLSIALAVFNILPIPVLDGGHLVFLLYEGITRREPSLRVRMVVQQVGFVLLLAFMAFVIFNDITRL